jgi:Alpha-L-arabinofuranosidase B, catalytic./NPCBM-associated, NEW3 domain of alpha-galactosidase.
MRNIMKHKSRFLITLALALILPVAMMMLLAMSGVGRNTTPPRPEGPCDIYAAAGNPCVAAHSSTRALYASYNGPLYQVMRQSDGKTLDIGVVQPGEGDPGGYADASAQDAFCANTYCWITTLYDQSGNGNHLVQAPRGGFSGPGMGGFNNIPIADMAPITIMGHKAYGVFIEPGMGLRLNDAKNTAVDDQAEGQYWVINGHHYNSGCCYDYGNAETDSRDDGDGTMETTYYGNANAWYHGQAPGPWIMTDQENNLVGGVNASPNDKYLPNLPSITWRFVTAMADGEPHHWRSMGGDAQRGDLQVMFDGTRVINDRNSYDPMRKQGAILLGNGGDNSNGSQGTFYEGAMTAPGTFPTKETNQKIQNNVVSAMYNVQRLSLAPANANDTPPGLQTFSPRSSQNSTVTFTNTTGVPVKDVTLSIFVPKGWNSVVLSSKETSKKFADPIAPGAKVSATFVVTSGSDTFNGDIVGKALWSNSNGQTQSEIIAEKVRNVSPIKINEFRITGSSPDNSTNSFIELYNASTSVIDISNWTLTQHQTQLPIFSSIKIPAGTKVTAKGFYLLGLSNSGLVVPAKKGESILYVRNIKGMSVGDAIEIDNGSSKEIHKIAAIGTTAGPGEPKTPSPFGGGRPVEPGTPTTLWQPLPDGRVITIPKGSTNVPVTNVDGFEVGQKMAIGYGATYPAVAQAIEKYEVVTITIVGKPGTQAWLSTDAKAGDTNIRVSSVTNISVGDKIRLDIASKGHGTETVTVTRVGTQSARSASRGPLTATDDPGTGLELAEPLKFNHSSNIPFSVRGTGISFEPAAAFAHSSNEPLLPLGTGITLDSPLSNDHAINAVVRDPMVTTAGYQETAVPNQWFGGPALSSGAGNMILHDAAGNVVDGLNYGGLVDPWTAEGYQAASGASESGCYVPSPGANRGFRMAPTSTTQPDRSAGRFPDGADSDFNCRDFLLQNTITLLAATPAGSNNIKVASVADFTVGQKIIIGTGANSETAVIKTIGTTGGTTVSSATQTGTKFIPVVSVEGFSAGQTITIDSDANLETAVVASTTGGRRRFGFRGTAPVDTITVTSPLAILHNVGAQVSGSGITLNAPFTKAQEKGAQVASNIPTPGEPNQYIRKP